MRRRRIWGMRRCSTNFRGRRKMGGELGRQWGRSGITSVR
jgi:hypothetical protein